MSQANYKDQAQEMEKQVSNEERGNLTKEVDQVRKEKEALEVRMNEFENCIALAKAELESATNSSVEYKKRFDTLQTQLSTKISEVIEQKDLESAETRRALQVSSRETSELKRLHQETVSKLSQVVESKLKLETMVNELQNAQLQAQSDAEDRDLESQYACEDMRKERAQLKCKLSMKEKEASMLKESCTNSE